VVAYIMVNRAANGGGGGGGGGGDGNNNNQNPQNPQNPQKRSLFQRDVMYDLHMNTARAAEIAPRVVPTRPHPRRFVVDWQGADTTGSDV
jgi:hypothetical protein